MNDNKMNIGELSNLGTGFGKELGSSIDIAATISELKTWAENLAWVLKAKVFYDITNSDELDAYNKIIGNPDKFKIVEKDTQWVEEKLDRGQSTQRYAVILHYQEYSEELFKQKLKELMAKYGKLVEEEIASSEESKEDFGEIQDISGAMSMDLPKMVEEHSEKDSEKDSEKEYLKFNAELKKAVEKSEVENFEQLQEEDDIDV